MVGAQVSQQLLCPGDGGHGTSIFDPVLQRVHPEYVVGVGPGDAAWGGGGVGEQARAQ